MRRNFPGLAAVSRLALFGSVARDEATEESDRDILVDIGEAPRWNRFCEGFDFMEEISPLQSGFRPVPYYQKSSSRQHCKRYDLCFRGEVR